MKGISPILLFLLHCCAGVALAQHTQTLQRVVRDSSGAGIPYVLVEGFCDSAGKLKPWGYIWTDSLGRYALPPAWLEDQLVLAFRAMGWQSDTLRILEQETDPIGKFEGAIIQQPVKMPDLVLKPASEELASVTIVDTAIPYFQRGDTTVFKPEFFRDGTERVLEDLLAKLPGVRVSQEGAVYFRGKHVSRILWEGDDLLGADYALATRRLPPGMAAAFRFVDRYEDNPLLKSLGISDELILDIDIRNSFRGKWLGDDYLGVGIAPMALAGVHAYRIRKKGKAMVLADATSFRDASGSSPVPLFIDQDEDHFLPELPFSWHHRPRLQPDFLTLPLIQSGRGASFSGGPHLRFGRGSHLNARLEGYLEEARFREEMRVLHLTRPREWYQGGVFRDAIGSGSGRLEGLLRLSEKANLSIQGGFHGLRQRWEKTDSISGSDLPRLLTSERLEPLRFGTSGRLDGLWKVREDLAWRVLAHHRWNWLADSYRWEGNGNGMPGEQRVDQGQGLSRLQIFCIRPAWKLEASAQQTVEYFGVQGGGNPPEAAIVSIRSRLLWLGGWTHLARQAHALVVSGAAGPGEFRHQRPDGRYVAQWRSLVALDLRHRWRFSKRWRLESSFSIRPRLPEAAMLFRGEVRTSILQRETGLGEMVITHDRQLQSRIQYTDNRKLLESQLQVSFRSGSPYIGERTLMDSRPDWLIEKRLFLLARGWSAQWHLDKYIMGSSLSAGVHLIAQGRRLPFAVDAREGENRFSSLQARADLRGRWGKWVASLTPTYYHRNNRLAVGRIPPLPQWVWLASLSRSAGQAYLKVQAEYLPRKGSAVPHWIWARLEAKISLTGEYYLFVEWKNLLNQRRIDLGEMGTDSMRQQLFNVNPSLLTLRAVREF